MKTDSMIRCFLYAILSCALMVSAANATIDWTGDVNPANPATWDLTADAYVGDTVYGTVMVDGDDDLVCLDGYISHDSGSTGLGCWVLRRKR